MSLFLSMKALGLQPGARVLIPEGVHMTYDHVSEARLFTVRVDGKLEFSTEVNSQMVVDTIVISPSGALQIGTETDPVDPNVNVDIIFANNGPIDVTWDPMLLSRGLISHGEVEIHGAVKDSHEKVIDEPMAGVDLHMEQGILERFLQEDDCSRCPKYFKCDEVGMVLKI